MLLVILLISCLQIGHDVLAQCNSGWHFFGQACYAYGDSMVTFAAAEFSQTDCIEPRALFSKPSFHFTFDFRVIREMTPAKEICNIYTAHLAEVGSAAENNFVKSIARNKSAGAVWIGGSDIFNEGTWQWMTTGHRIFNFLDWAPHQPDESGSGEDCLGLWNSANYQWNDFPCNQLATFLCETEFTQVVKKTN